jgi:uncharacterized protein YybS (DUF2232 family)
VRFREALDLTRAATLAAALFLLGGVVPVVGALAMLCAPAPILLYAIGRPREYLRTAVTLTLTMVLVGVAAGPLRVLGFSLSLGLATVLIGLLIRRQWPFELIVFTVTAAMMAAATGAMLLAAGSPAGVIKHLHDSIALSMSHSDAVYQKLGMSLSESKELSNRVLDITTLLAPALAAALGAITVLINLGLVWRWLGKPRLGYQLFCGLPTWRTPEWLIWLLLATGFGIFIPLQGARIAATNGFVLVAAIYFCQGLAIMAYYLQKLAMPMVLRGVVYVIALLQPVLAALVCLAGIFDMWIDFRRLKPPSQEAGSFDDFL